MTTVRPDELNAIMGFDSVVMVRADGSVIYAPGVYAPDSVYWDHDRVDMAGWDDWSLLRGYSGQQGGSDDGVMHPSEYIAGAMARDILAEPGYYAAIAIDTDHGENVGWAVARLDELPPVTTVWSAHGHTFTGEGEERSRCLVCGALYTLRRKDGEPSFGEYVANDGTEPMRCSFATDQVHGYPGERNCEAANGRPCAAHAETGKCAHTDRACNCLLCA